MHCSGPEEKTHASRDLAQLIYGDDPFILMTAQQKGIMGRPLESICLAMKDITGGCRQCRILVPLPRTIGQDVQQRFLQMRKRVILCEPLDYPDFVWAMNRSSLILTDSGGVQEEASGLKKPVLVMRDLSERPEALDTGTALLVGTDRETIRHATVRILTDGAFRESLLNRGENPFGDGTASLRIADSILGYYEGR